MAAITQESRLNEINEFNLFKNEVFGNLREIETKLDAKINITQSKLIDDIEAQSIKMNNLINNNKEMLLSILSQKLKIEKIAELESFKNKMDAMMITHEVRIKNNLEEISRIKLRYDKIVSENLYVSGFIGNSCQFRNLSEYLSYNISEVSKLKLEKEQLKKDIKDLKSKFEGLMKNMITLNDKSIQLCNKYTDNKKGEFEKLIENYTNEMSQKNVDNKMMICQFTENAQKTEKKFKEEFNKLLDMKSEFINIIEEKFNDIRKYHDELNRKVIDTNLDICIHKKKIENINERIKDLHQNTKDISFQMRNYYCANNKINNLIEKIDKLGDNNGVSNDMLKFKNEINYNINNNINTYSVSPKKKIIKRQGEASANYKKNIDEEYPFKTNLTHSTEKIKPQRKIYNKLGIVNNKNETSDSDSSISIKKEHNNANNKKKNMNKNENKNTNDIDSKNNDTMVNKKTNTFRAQSMKKSIKIINENKTLPALTRNIRDDLDEMKKICNSSNEINKSEISMNAKEEKKRIKKSKIIALIHNEHKKINQKKEIIQKKDQQLEQDKQACKYVALTLPDPLKEVMIEKKKRIMKNKFKTDIVNNLINSYRAKLFSKAHSPEEKFEINNEILDIPKKVSQAFGRTTYTFYFKKDQIKNLEGNKNNNSLKVKKKLQKNETG
jgi:hypothetical protein